MSCLNMVWALYRPDLTPAERMVLVHMANTANRALVCHDTMAKISRLLELSERGVHRILRDLANKGLIRIQTRRRKVGNHYHLLIPDSDADRRVFEPKEMQPSGEYIRPIIQPEIVSETVIVALYEGLLPDSESGKDALFLPDSESGQKPFLPDSESGQESPKEVRKNKRPPVPPQAGGACVDPAGHFDNFWQRYPRKEAKERARQAFAASVQAGIPPETILDGLSAFVFSDEHRFVPHPASWLRARRWEDEPPPPDKPKFRNGFCEIVAREGFGRDRSIQPEEHPNPFLRGLAYVAR